MCTTQVKMHIAWEDSELFSLKNELVSYYWWSKRNVARLRGENNFLYFYNQCQS